MVQFIDNRPTKAGIAGSKRRRRRTNKAPEPYYTASNGQTIFQSIDEGDFDFSSAAGAPAISPSNEGSVFRTIAAPKHPSTQACGFESISAAATVADRRIEESNACSTLEKQKQQIEFLMEQLEQRDAELAQLQNEKRTAFASRDPASRYPPPMFEASFDDTFVEGRKPPPDDDCVFSGTASLVEEVVRSPRKTPPVSRQVTGSVTNVTRLPSETSPRTKLLSQSSSSPRENPQSKSLFPSKSIALADSAVERNFPLWQAEVHCCDEAAIANHPRHQTPLSISSYTNTEEREMAYRAEIQKLLNEHSQLLASVASRHKTQILDLEAEKTRLEQTAQRYSDELKKAVEYHQAAIDSMVEKHVKEVHHLNEVHRETSTALHLQCVNALAERDRKYSAELEAARIKAAEESRVLQAQLSERANWVSMALREEHRLKNLQSEELYEDELKVLEGEVATWERRAKRRKLKQDDLAKQVDELKLKVTCRCSQEDSGVNAKSFDPRRLSRPFARKGASILENLDSSPPAKQNVSLAHQQRTTSTERRARRGKRDRDEFQKHTSVDETHRSVRTSPRKLACDAPAQKQRPTDITYSGKLLAVCTRHRAGKQHTTLVIHSPPRDNDVDYL